MSKDEHNPSSALGDSQQYGAAREEDSPEPDVARVKFLEEEEEEVDGLSNRSGSETLINVVQNLMPKFKMLPTQDFLALSILVALPTIIYIAGFTKMGYGVQVYNVLSSHFEKQAKKIIVGLASFAFFLYVIDVHYWRTRCGKLTRRLCYNIIFVGIITVVLAVSGQAPYGPISIYLITTTAWIVSIQRICYSDIEIRNFVSWLGGPFFLVGTITFLMWFSWTWMDHTHEWTLAIKLIDAEETGCDPDFTNHEQCRGDAGGSSVCFYQDQQNPAAVFFPPGCDPDLCPDVYKQCTNTFIIWAGPFLVSVGLLFLSFFTTMVQDQVSSEEEMVRFSKIWMILVFGMWVSASLAGAGSDVTFTLAALTLAGFIASGIFLSAIFNRVEREEHIHRLWDSFKEKYADYLGIARGLLLLTCSPVAILFLVVSTIKQRIRQVNCFSQVSSAPLNTKSLRNIGASSWLTIEARRMLREFLSWNRAQVYTWVVYWGLGYVTLTVIASKFTTLFLSWLIEETKEMSLGIVTAIMVGVGLTMFLLPPVPGAPIYLTVGIVIIPVGMDTLGLVGCMAYAVAVSLALKLLATVLQQKAIGSMLKGNVQVRKLVGVNSTVMRAFKLLLSKPGLGLAKVCILTGGPDWPTSVFCGIIDLPLIPILIGTIPCLALILPTVLTGSFTYMAGMTDDEGVSLYPWAGMASSVSAAAAALVLFGMMILAAYFVEDTLSKRQDEVAALSWDEEVKELEEEDKIMNKALEEVTDWDEVPLLPRLTLSCSVCFMIVSCYLFFFFHCFKVYALTDTIEVQLDGDWMNLMEPLGKIAIILFSFATVLYFSFSSWAGHQARVLVTEETVSSLKASAVTESYGTITDNLL